MMLDTDATVSLHVSRVRRNVQQSAPGGAHYRWRIAYIRCRICWKRCWVSNLRCRIADPAEFKHWLHIPHCGQLKPIQNTTAEDDMFLPAGSRGIS